MSNETEEATLICLECGEESDEEARGWRCYIADEAEVVILCPACVAREFD